MKQVTTKGKVVVFAAVLCVATGGWTEPRQAATTSNQEVNDAFVQKISEQIAGYEQEPAGQVFKNIQLDICKKTPASRVLLIMNLGYIAAH